MAPLFVCLWRKTLVVSRIMGVVMVRRSLVVLVLIGSLTGCGGGSGPAESTDSEAPVEAVSTPTPEESPSSVSADGESITTAGELTAVLLTPQNLGDGWELEPEPAGAPGITLCHWAETHQDTGALPWQAFTLMNSRDADTPGVAVYWQHLMAGEPAQMQATFDALKTEMESCIGVGWEGEDLSQRHSEGMDVTPVGDARVAQHTYAEDDQGAVDFRHVVVLDDTVLMMLTVIEFRQSPTDIVIVQEEFDQIVTMAAQRLPS